MIDAQGISDAELVRRVCAGDAEAASYLFAKRMISTVAFLSRQFYYDDLANDLYLHLRENSWQRLRTWNGTSSLLTWMRQVCVRLCLTQARSLKSRTPRDAADPLLQPSPAAAPDEHLIAAHERAALMAGIESLKEPRDRLVLRRLYFEGRSVVDTAREFGLSKEHVHVVSSRAVARLRKVVEDAL
jgi:RNA polymerase sigma factor (sigma-70 family)